MKVDVVIVGGGPSGLMLSQLLMLQGISTLVLEKHTRAHVLERIRAGVLEWGTVELLEEAGVADRLHREGLAHDGVILAWGERQLRVDFRAELGQSVMIYGQTEVTRDLYAAQDQLGAVIHEQVSDITFSGLEGDAVEVRYIKDGAAHVVTCAYIAGCDGFHGVCRQTIPAARRREIEMVYPLGWLGILSHTKPLCEELVYSRSDRGFALASMRNPNLTRSYIQVPLDTKLSDWSDEAFWEEFRLRLPEALQDQVIPGPSVEMSIAPLRSFLCETMSFGRLFLCGDAAHIVPPTGAKGLNLAASDVYYLSHALIDALKASDGEGLALYESRALRRVRQAMRFSWWMTRLVHPFPGGTRYEEAMQLAEFELLESNAAARKVFSESYTCLPY